METSTEKVRSRPGPPVKSPVGTMQQFQGRSPSLYSTPPHSHRTSSGMVQSPGGPQVGPYDGSVTPYDSIVTAAHNPEDLPVSPYIQIQPRRTGPPKETKTAYKFAILGFLGLHHFYLGRPKFGVLYLFTGGLLLIGWLLDLCRMTLLVKQANNMIEQPEMFQNKRTMLDAYIVWFPLGILGAHHYYLGRMYWGVAYTFTIGLLGIGWAVDGARMKQLVKDANKALAQGPVPAEREEKKLSECYILAVTPLGLLGAHYYYLERWMFGVMYTFSLGLLGVGWLVDLFTLQFVFDRANKIRLREVDPEHRYLSEAYKLIFPCGFMGLHHFYLRRPGWGVLYLCTFGCVFIGWIVDFFRLPSLVREANEAAEREAANLSELHNRLYGQTIAPADMPPLQPPPQYSPRPGRHQLHPYSLDRRPSTEVSPLHHTSTNAHTNRSDAPPPYTPRAVPSHSKVTSHHRPLVSTMDVITEEDEDAISVISGASRQTAMANDVSLENSLNDQIYDNMAHESTEL